MSCQMSSSALNQSLGWTRKRRSMHGMHSAQVRCTRRSSVSCGSLPLIWANCPSEWYLQKQRNPWYLPSVNAHLSKVLRDDLAHHEHLGPTPTVAARRARLSVSLIPSLARSPSPTWSSSSLLRCTPRPRSLKVVPAQPIIDARPASAHR
jgi:hypothetical protein